MSISLTKNKSEEKYKILIENSIEGFSIIDLKGNFIDVNKSYCKMTGYSKEELLKMNLSDIELKEKPYEIKEHIKKVFKKGGDNFETIHKRKDKNLIYLEVTVNYIKDYRQFFVFFRDITYKKITEEKIKKNEIFLNSIVENIPDMIFVKDAKNLKFELFNKAGEQLLGHNRKDMIGKNDYDFFPKVQADFFTKKDREVLNNKYLLDIPTEPINTKNGQRILHTKKIPILDENNNPIYLLGISEDITEKKRIEEQLKRQFEELKELDILKTEFLSITTHELRTPIIPIKSQSELLLSGSFGEINLKQKKSLEMIIRNTKRLDKLIREILDVSRIQANKLEIRLKKNDLKKCFSEVIEILKPLIKEKNINLIKTYGEIPKFRFDKERIIQVFNNLLENAIKFSPKNSSIRIIIKRIKDNLLIQIKDQGIGVKKEDIKKLFMPFSQINSAYNRKYKGSGLGLAICKAIIEKHEGYINLKSKKNKGTTVYFYLPIR
jgi:PAS domain S-box-containing protein